MSICVARAVWQFAIVHMEYDVHILFALVVVDFPAMLEVQCWSFIILEY